MCNGLGQDIGCVVGCVGSTQGQILSPRGAILNRFSDQKHIFEATREAYMHVLPRIPDRPLFLAISGGDFPLVDRKIILEKT